MMKKDFTSKNRAMKRSQPKWGTARLLLMEWKWVAVAGVALMLLFCGTRFFVRQHQEKMPGFSMVSHYFSPLTQWIAERKRRLHQNLDKAKQLATNKNMAEPQIHFEFYTTLPHMQVMMPETTEQRRAEPRKHTALTKPVAAKVAIVNADELEREFSQQIKRNKKVNTSHKQYNDDH